ncbi:MAG: hypothetical protein U0270_23815 [Labilithrix sp.]
MLLTAAVTKAEIAALVDALTPLGVVIDEHRGRSITLGRPRLELVPDAGIRLRGDARLTWDVAGVAIPVTLKAWQVLLVPRIVDRESGRALAFEPVIEVLDLKRVPGFLDDKIARAIGDGLAQNRSKLSWELGRVLSKQLALPARIGGGTFALSAVDGAVGVSEEDVKLTLRFEARIDRPRPDPDLAPRSSRRNPMSERRPEIR